MEEKHYAGAPATVWRLVEKVCLNFLKYLTVTFDDLQKSNVHVSQQVQNLERLDNELQEHCGEAVNESIPESSIIFHVTASVNFINMGLYVVTRDSLKNSEILIWKTAMDELKYLDQAGQTTALRATAAVYLINRNTIIDKKAERNCDDQDLEDVRPHTPLHFIELSTADFVSLVYKRKKRIIQTLAEQELQKITE